MTSYLKSLKLITWLPRIGLLFLLLSPFSSAAGGQLQPNAIEWRITDTRVVSAGREVASGEGKTRAMVIEGKAVTETPDAIFPEGVFKINLAVVKPEQKKPAKQADRWHLRGSWTITAKNADPVVMKARYNPYVLAGALNAETPYDPALGGGALEANVRLQRGGVRPWAGPKARGTFAGSSKFEGKLTTPFIPDMHKGKEGGKKSE